MHRTATGHGVALQQLIEQAGQRCQFAADRCAGQAAQFELGAPGEHMRAGHGAKFFGGRQAHEMKEILKVTLVRTPCARVVDIGEPLDRCWHCHHVLEFIGRQATFAVLGVDQSSGHIPYCASIRALIAGYSGEALSSRIFRSCSGSGTRCCHLCCSPSGSAVRMSWVIVTPAAAKRLRTLAQKSIEVPTSCMGVGGTWY